MNQCRLIVNWTPVNKFQWNSNRNFIIFNLENAFEIFVGHNSSHFVQGEMLKVWCTISLSNLKQQSFYRHSWHHMNKKIHEFCKSFACMKHISETHREKYPSMLQRPLCRANLATSCVSLRQFSLKQWYYFFLLSQLKAPSDHPKTGEAKEMNDKVSTSVSFFIIGYNNSHDNQVMNNCMW